MKIKNASFFESGGNPNLNVTIEQELEGKTWILTKSCSGDTANDIWGKWGTNNDDEIIALVLALP